MSVTLVRAVPRDERDERDAGGEIPGVAFELQLSPLRLFGFLSMGLPPGVIENITERIEPLMSAPMHVQADGVTVLPIFLPTGLQFTLVLPVVGPVCSIGSEGGSLAFGFPPSLAGPFERMNPTAVAARVDNTMGAYAFDAAPGKKLCLFDNDAARLSLTLMFVALPGGN